MKVGRLLFLVLGVLGEISNAHAVTLEAALAQTLQNNPHIRRAKTGLESAAGQRLVLRSVALPKALIGGILGDQGGYRAGSSSNKPFALAYGAFVQPVFNAGIPAAYRRGDVALLIAQQQLNVTVAAELQNARLAFYSALYNRSLESLGRAQRERLDENVAGEKARYEAGKSGRGEFTAATLQARELDPEIEAAHAAYGAACLQLAAAMGSALGRGAALPVPEGSLDFQVIDLRWPDEVKSALAATSRSETGPVDGARGTRRSAHHRSRLLSYDRWASQAATPFPSAAFIGTAAVLRRRATTRSPPRCAPEGPTPGG